MAITLATKPGQGTQQNFQYKRLQRSTRGRLVWNPNLHWVEYGPDGAKQPVRFQYTYSSTPGTVRTRARARAPLSYADTVLHRPVGQKRHACILRTPTKPAKHTDHVDCTTDAYWAQDRHADVELRETRTMEIGVFATADFAKDAILGLYTGDLVSVPRLTPEEASYSATIPLKDANNRNALVAVNSYQQGSWTRFINHHCENNVKWSHLMNCGNTAVLAVRAKRKILAEEEICLNYGEEYFRVGGNKEGPIISPGCLCGSTQCHSEHGRDYTVPVTLAVGDGETAAEDKDDKPFKSRAKKGPTNTAIRKSSRVRKHVNYRPE